MQKIQYCSDLHLEFPENEKYMRDHPLEKAGDILVMAGDIVPFSELTKFEDFFDHLSQQYEAVYWLPGNHEYYDSDIKKRSGSFKEEIRLNIYLLNNSTIELEGIRLIFSTLWTALSEENHETLSVRWPDFKQIKNGQGNFAPSDYNNLFEQNRDFLREELSKDTDATTIVITHHVPTFEKFPTDHRENTHNETFAVDLSEMIEETKPDYWIYAHDHDNRKPFEIGNTKLLTNQLGYVQYNEHGGFSLDARV